MCRTAYYYYYHTPPQVDPLKATKVSHGLQSLNVICHTTYGLLLRPTDGSAKKFTKVSQPIGAPAKKFTKVSQLVLWLYDDLEFASSAMWREGYGYG